MKQNNIRKSNFLSALFFFFIFISDNAIHLMGSKFDLKDSLNNNNILKSNEHSQLSHSKGQSILQMSSKIRLNLRLNKFISYYAEYSNIKIKSLANHINDMRNLIRPEQLVQSIQSVHAHICAPCIPPPLPQSTL